MRFVSFREFRNRPGAVRTMLQDQDLAITAKGQPIGLLIKVDADNLEETFSLVRKLRAQMAVSRMRRDANAKTSAKLTPGEIQQEIQAVRRTRKA